MKLQLRLRRLSPVEAFLLQTDKVLRESCWDRARGGRGALCAISQSIMVPVEVGMKTAVKNEISVL